MDFMTTHTLFFADLGLVIHNKAMEEMEDEKQEAIMTARQEAMAESKTLHEEMLEEAMKDAQVKFNETLRDKEKAMAKDLKVHI